MNMTNAMVALETSEGFAVIEVLECCALDISDEVHGSLDSKGEERLRNVSKNEEFDVAVRGIHCSSADAMALIG